MAGPMKNQPWKIFAFTVALLLALCGAVPVQADEQDHRDDRDRHESSGFWHTRGNQVLDSRDRPVRIQGVNWYGFETPTFVAHGLWAQDYKFILNAIKDNGFNVVRLPFSNEMVETDPVPTAMSFSNASGPINTDLQGLTSLQILDKIVSYAGDIGLHIILDNHRSNAGSSTQENGLWYTDAFPESAWLRDWVKLALRYRHDSTVIGMDLRNEPHFSYNNGACWTGDIQTNAAGCPESNTARNWPKAAERAGNLIHLVNPQLLIFVEGTDEYNNDFTWFGGSLNGVASFPVKLRVPNRLVYSAHDYGPDLFQQGWFNSATTYASLVNVWETHWAFISNQGLAPVWVGEFGTTNTPAGVLDTAPGSQGQWFSSLIFYLDLHPRISWAYWAVNGNDRYGLLDGDFQAVAQPEKSLLLSLIQR